MRKNKARGRRQQWISRNKRALRKLDTTFECLFCCQGKTVRCKLDFENEIDLSHAVDVYHDWVDACEQANAAPVAPPSMDHEGTEEAITDSETKDTFKAMAVSTARSPKHVRPGVQQQLQLRRSPQAHSTSRSTNRQRGYHTPQGPTSCSLMRGSSSEYEKLPPREPSSCAHGIQERPQLSSGQCDPTQYGARTLPSQSGEQTLDFALGQAKDQHTATDVTSGASRTSRSRSQSQTPRQCLQLSICRDRGSQTANRTEDSARSHSRDSGVESIFGQRRMQELSQTLEGAHIQVRGRTTASQGHSSMDWDYSDASDGKGDEPDENSDEWRDYGFDYGFDYDYDYDNEDDFERDKGQGL
ncbi:hypothetical protein EDD11_005667 [Mortierella claussenii]|nr:hypothetical protein EDD11_005667 [Mortierella claussenii]